MFMLKYADFYSRGLSLSFKQVRLCFLSDSSFLRDDISVELKYLFVAVYAFVILLEIMIISLFRAVIATYLGQSNELTYTFPFIRTT